MPERCPITSRAVIVPDFWGKEGQYFCTGASRSNRPRSHNCIAAVAVRDLEIDARRNKVCSLAGTLFSRSAEPNPAAHSSSESSTIAMETPGTCVEAIYRDTADSICVRFPAEMRLSWASPDSPSRKMTLINANVEVRAMNAKTCLFIGKNCLLPEALKQLPIQERIGDYCVTVAW